MTLARRRSAPRREGAEEDRHSGLPDAGEKAAGGHGGCDSIGTVVRRFTKLYVPEKPPKPAAPRVRSRESHRKDMSVSDQTNPETTPSSDRPRRPWRRAAIATLIGGLAAGIGAAAIAHGGPGGWHGGWGGGRGWHGEMDPQAMQRRAEAMVKWWLADVDATEAQQQKVAEIMITTMKDLAPLREQHRAARRQVVEILAKPQIDRAALEALRAQELKLAEDFSQRITRSLADAAEVLTPEQRAKLAARIERRHGPRRG